MSSDEDARVRAMTDAVARRRLLARAPAWTADDLEALWAPLRDAHAAPDRWAIETLAYEDAGRA